MLENKNPLIFLIGGKARHGKDTLSSYLKDAYERKEKKVLITQLSKYIKYYAREITGWDLSEENKPRQLLQQLGTDVIRGKLGKEDLFIKRMIDDLEIFSYFYDIIIISDWRLQLEHQQLKEAFPDIISVIINRPDYDNGLSDEEKQHVTEIDLDNYKEVNYKIINTTMENLSRSAERICAEN